MEVIFNNISSREFGLGVKTYPPIPQAEANINKYEVPGRDGFLTEDLETKKGIQIPVEFNFVNKDVPQNAYLIKNWLKGSGDLIFSNEFDKKYKATIINTFDIASAIKMFGEFTVTFDCQPHKYDVHETFITINSKPATLYNPGSDKSLPIIKIYATGDITLSINGNEVTIDNVDEYVVIDSQMVDCYKDALLKNNDMSGDFPYFKEGVNSISWIGNITKLEITPNWRY
jgi:predicted phage tail component-like protein